MRTRRSTLRTFEIKLFKADYTFDSLSLQSLKVNSKLPIFLSVQDRTACFVLAQKGKCKVFFSSPKMLPFYDENTDSLCDRLYFLGCFVQPFMKEAAKFDSGVIRGGGGGGLGGELVLLADRLGRTGAEIASKEFCHQMMSKKHGHHVLLDAFHTARGRPAALCSFHISGHEDVFNGSSGGH
ncbi:hypothetical protein JOB18_035375 [Solea senegalensis]|uniref:Uncharacterized protein n=1 Tax=Solea senegalensis TaxID=28829 RepID=A0AAV6RKB3_SOLSE|nr:hypothetical protein JOB18_035375 [Solea senegalensis]